ncbi:MAG: hypothetical protein IKO52_07120 [Clostridia bacterium]|nr:hypothetical protein [Clostridia bacterium]
MSLSFDMAFYGGGFRHKPVSFPTVGRHSGELFRDAQLHQISQLGPGILPLFSDVLPESSAKPSVSFFHSVLHGRCLPVFFEPWQRRFHGHPVSLFVFTRL